MADFPVPAKPSRTKMGGRSPASLRVHRITLLRTSTRVPLVQGPRLNLKPVYLVSDEELYLADSANLGQSFCRVIYDFG